MIKYCIHPGSVTTREGDVESFTYEELIALYGVDEDECIDKQFVPQNEDMNYIHLKPREDGVYTEISQLEQLGDEIEWGEDFDGKKRFTMETDHDTLYAEREAEELP